MILPVIQMFIFISYIVFVSIKFGILPSISDSYYLFSDWKRILFTLFCFSLGSLMFLQEIGVFPWFVISGSGLCLTGAAMQFKEKVDGKVHVVGAYSAIIFGLAGLIFERGLYFPSVTFILLAVLSTATKNKTWWIECSAFACIVLGLLISSY